ncbi:MAG: SGNH/GDSL hydrolase family protein [Bacteroidales bacterium]
MKNKITVLIIFLFAFCSISAQDWANLGRFRDENAKLGNPAKGEKRVVFMGNSITEGWLQANPEFFKGKPYINRGISGQTTPQMLVRFYADVVALKPSVVVILAGTNDIAGNTGPSTLEMIMDNLKAMSEIAKANNIKVVLSSVLPATEYPWKPGMEPADKIISLNKMIKDYADANNLVYLDYYSALTDGNKGMKKEYTNDGVHATKEGYMVMGPLAEAAIYKALKQKK